MSRLVTLSNGGGLSATVLNGIQDDYEGLYSTWRNLWERSITWAGVMNSASTYMYGPAGSKDDGFAWGQPYWGAPFAPGAWSRNIDPTKYTTSFRSLEFRLAGKLYINSTAPVANFTINLCSNMSIVQPVPAGDYHLKFATILSTASAGIAAPSANSVNSFTTGSFSLSSADNYGATIKSSANTAAGSAITSYLCLQYRRV